MTVVDFTWLMAEAYLNLAHISVSSPHYLPQYNFLSTVLASSRICLHKPGKVSDYLGVNRLVRLSPMPETGHWSEEHILIKADHRRSIALGSIPDVGMNVRFSPEVKNNQSVCYTTHQPARETFLVTGLFSKCTKDANEERCQVVLDIWVT